MALHLILLGPPGCGKGTQAQRLTEARHLKHLSTGDMLRQAIAEGTSTGKAAESIMQRGGLVPDHLVIDLIRDRLDKRDCRNGVIFDGFPRTVDQAIALDALLEEKKLHLNGVIELAVEDDLLVERVCGRLIHQASGRSYHRRFNPPKEDMKDDVTGEPLIQRQDDNEQTVRQRLANYHRQTAPLIPYYEQQGVLFQVDASLPIDEITHELLSLTSGLCGTGTLSGVCVIDPRTVKSGVHVGTNKVTLPLGAHPKTSRSNRQLREDLHKHDRAKFGPKNKFSAPATSNMDYGWKVALESTAEEKAKVLGGRTGVYHPRIQSRETMYANALILGPRHT